MSSIYDAWDNGDRPAIRRRFARLEEITRMAQEAGIRVAGPMDSVDPKNIYAHELERFAALVLAIVEKINTPERRLIAQEIRNLLKESQ